MSKYGSRPMGVLIALVLAMAACGALAGCAGSGERLPECRGKAVPINSLNPAAALMGASGRPVSLAAAATVNVSEVDAR
jgi:hypothetical protein